MFGGWYTIATRQQHQIALIHGPVHDKARLVQMLPKWREQAAKSGFEVAADAQAEIAYLAFDTLRLGCANKEAWVTPDTGPLA